MSDIRAFSNPDWTPSAPPATAKPKPAASDRQGFIYFLSTIARDRVKIGFSRVPDERWARLQKWSPSQLELLACVPGTSGQEWELHTLFAEHRLHFEWFVASRGILLCADYARRLNRVPMRLKCEFPRPPDRRRSVSRGRRA